MICAGASRSERANSIATPSTRREQHPDAQLLALVDEHAVTIKECDRLEAIWLELDNQRCESGKSPRGHKAADTRRLRQWNISRELEDRIISTPAQTLEGVTAKARALSTGLVDGESVEEGIDSNFAASMARDLLAISGMRA
jgi:hypothetical protein